jgi:hypothetical protein
MLGRKPLNFTVQASKLWLQSKKPCAQGFALRAQGSKPCGASLVALRAEQKGLRVKLGALPTKRRASPAKLRALPAKLRALPGRFVEAPIEQKASPRHSSG